MGTCSAEAFERALNYTKASDVKGKNKAFVRRHFNSFLPGEPVYNFSAFDFNTEEEIEGSRAHKAFDSAVVAQKMGYQVLGKESVRLWDGIVFEPFDVKLEVA